jgi:tetratricopeptide (TPR) repeat protein
MKCSHATIMISLIIFLLLSMGGCIKQQTMWEYELKQGKKEIAALTKTIERNSSDDEAYYRRGVVYYEIKECYKAILDFNRAIEINPNNAQLYARRAYAHYCNHSEEKGSNDSRKAEEIDPRIFEDYKNRGLGYASETTNEFIFPALTDRRYSKGNLILGLTTMKQAVEMLPQWPGHPPRGKSQKELGTSPGAVGEALRNIRYQFNPAFADFILAFDKNKILIVIISKVIDSLHSNSEEEIIQQEKIIKMIKQHHFKEVLRDEQTITLRGEIMPCITMEVFKPTSTSTPISRIGYFYTCPTK